MSFVKAIVAELEQLRADLEELQTADLSADFKYRIIIQQVQSKVGRHFPSGNLKSSDGINKQQVVDTYLTDAIGSINCALRSRRTTPEIAKIRLLQQSCLEFEAERDERARQKVLCAMGSVLGEFGLIEIKQLVLDASRNFEDDVY